MEHDEKKMSKTDYDAYLSLALSSANNELINVALEEGYAAFEEARNA